jgi:hypothetical protein
MLAYLFVVLAVAVRFMPHPWMFTPVTGSLLFFGARGPRRQLWIPFALLAASDVALTAVLWLGTKLGAKTKWVPVVGAALASSVSFFLITNLVAWAWLDMYPKNLSGVMMSYVAGLPFFRHALAGDLIFTVGMFATPMALHALSHALSRQRDSAAAA